MSRQFDSSYSYSIYSYNCQNQSVHFCSPESAPRSLIAAALQTWMKKHLTSSLYLVPGDNFEFIHLFICFETTIAHFSAVEDGLRKFLKLIQASLLLRYGSFKANKKVYRFKVVTRYYKQGSYICAYRVSIRCSIVVVAPPPALSVCESLSLQPASNSHSYLNIYSYLPLLLLPMLSSEAAFFYRLQC